jgi:chorismate mutase/prephenate dehydratase
MKVAYLGPKDTFTYKAAKSIFSSNDDFIDIKPIGRVVKSLEDGDVDYAVVAAENYYNGWVSNTLDAITRSSGISIIQEKAFPIVHCFAALKNRGDITRVLSKDQAIEQCDNYLTKNYPDADLIYVTSTGEAVKQVKDLSLKNAGVIASKKIIGQYEELELLAEDICPNNLTRFIVLGKEKTKSTGDDKTFIAVHPHVNDLPLILVRSILPLGLANVNLEYINSRPDHNGGHYFYLEADAHDSDECMQKSLDFTRYILDPKSEYPDTIRVLGSYPNSHWKD